MGFCVPLPVAAPITCCGAAFGQRRVTLLRQRLRFWANVRRLRPTFTVCARQACGLWSLNKEFAFPLFKPCFNPLIKADPNENAFGMATLLEDVVPSNPTIPCAAGCGMLMWDGPNTRPGASVCQGCRRRARTRVCATCGETFTARKASTNLKYCSMACTAIGLRGPRKQPVCSVATTAVMTSPGKRTAVTSSVRSTAPAAAGSAGFPAAAAP